MVTSSHRLLSLLPLLLKRQRIMISIARSDASYRSTSDMNDVLPQPIRVSATICELLFFRCSLFQSINFSVHVSITRENNRYHDKRRHRISRQWRCSERCCSKQQVHTRHTCGGFWTTPSTHF
jgi:hypothetical protein